MSGLVIVVCITVGAPVVIGILTNWLGPRPGGFTGPAVWTTLVVVSLVLVGAGLYNAHVFDGHPAAQGHARTPGLTTVPAPPGQPTEPAGTVTTLAPTSAAAQTTGRAASPPTAQNQQNQQNQPAQAQAAQQPAGWSGPPSVSVSPTSFENLNEPVALTVTVQATANAAIEGETVGLDVPVSPPNCPSLKPDPCDNQFSGGQYGGTDQNGNLTFSLTWYPGDACNYSGSGNEFTYPKGTYEFSVDIQDADTGLVSSADFSVTNGPDTPADAPSC